MTVDGLGTPSSLGGVPAPLIQLGGNAAAVAAAAAQQKVSAAQSRASATDQALLAKNAGTDANFVTSEENFGSYSHAEIYQHAQAMNVEGLRTAHTLWSAECTRLSDLSMSLQTSLLGLMNDGAWKGQSGDAARTAVGALGGATRQVADVFSTVSDRLDAAAWAAEATRLAVPPPATSSAVAAPNPDDPTSMIIPGLLNPATVTADQEAQTAAENAARATMNTLYAPSFPTTGDTVPAFGDAPRFGENGARVVAQASPGDPGSNTPDQGSPEPGVPESAAPTSEEPASTTPENTDAADSSGDTGNTADDGTSSTDDAGSTTAASTAAAPSTQLAQPGGQSPATPSPGAPNSAGSLGGSGSPVLGRQAPAVPGKAVPAPNTTPVAPRSALGGQSGSARVAGSPAGMGPMGSGGAGGRGKASDDEAEHRAPDYLRGVHPDWLAGTEAPPAVFGADAESARPVAGPSQPAPSPVPPRVFSTPAVRHEPEFAPAPVPSAPAVPANAADSYVQPDAPARPTAPPPSEAEAPQPEPPALSAEIASLLAQHGLSGTAQTSTPAGDPR
ncbi:hypothetical protein ACIA5E_25055 [Nocardia asteroides]|uniref:hypothetical protein n=1 Tax=Nocardia asteroides TaxID=1824 RepID=UPI0037B0BADA